ncbi:serine/threonine protein kinase [Streptomyces sp. NBC_01317]|uniref:serine/threonine-protein kinase n=1 Tax=Streptomyces sp. NBC_01317 TaxID=2903822 RepID=UPI002E12CF65|nr:serine/threonine protein kinase [Streptomyces sp. NBC_01317]
MAGRYRTSDQLGRGGMGEVWRARDEVLGRPVAVKLLRQRDADAAALARFELEGRTAARLSHPNVVTVYDSGTEADRGYLVMELVEGHSLAEELRVNGPTPPTTAARIGSQVAAGLAAAHHEGVVHRDVKPANLLLAPDGTVKIGDFGIARFADHSTTELTMNGQVIGTSAYLAPERALGRPAGPAADMYGLGCVLYELLTARPPFRADTPAVMVYRHVEAIPDPPSHRGPELPGELDEFVLRLLTKDPARRPTAEEAISFLSAPEDWIPVGRRTVRTPLALPQDVPPPHTTLLSGMPGVPAGTSEAPGVPGAPGGDARTRPDRRRRPGHAGQPRRSVLLGAAVTALSAIVVGVAATSSSGGRHEGPVSTPRTSAAEDTGAAGESPKARPATGPARDDAAVSSPAKAPAGAPGGAAPDRSAAPSVPAEKTPREEKTAQKTAGNATVRPSDPPPATARPSSPGPTPSGTPPPSATAPPTATATASDRPDPGTTPDTAQP